MPSSVPCCVILGGGGGRCCSHNRPITATPLHRYTATTTITTTTTTSGTSLCEARGLGTTPGMRPLHRLLSAATYLRCLLAFTHTCMGALTVLCLVSPPTAYHSPWAYNHPEPTAAKPVRQPLLWKPGSYGTPQTWGSPSAQNISA